MLVEAEVKGMHWVAARGPRAKEGKPPAEAGKEEVTGSPLKVPEEMPTPGF